MATKTGTRGPTFSPRLERLEERLTPAVQLDLSFDGDGKLTTHFGFGDDFAQGVALQGDGRILVAGAARVNGDDDFALARYNPDGSLDLSFGVNGGVTTDFGLKNDSAFAVAVDPRNGFIVAAGVAAVGTDQAIGVVRYTPDGRLDTSFGSGGKFLLFENDGADDGGTAVLVQDDGRILVGAFGTFAGTGEDFVLARLTADGRLDGSFGSGGFSRRDFAGGDDRPFDMALQSTGKILLVGQGDYRGDKDFILMRFNPDGTPDNSFGEFGDATTYVDFEGGDDFGYAVDVQPDDKIVVAGAATVGPDLDFGIARLDPNDGSYDPSFGGDGRVTTHFGHGHDRAFGVTVLPDGRILGTGSARIFADDDFAVAAYHPDGSRDTSLLPGDALSPAGTVTTDFDLGNDIGLNSVVQPDGSVVVVGEAFVLTDFDFAVARYSVPRPGPDGNIDTDRDGLLDAWEVNGLDVNGDGVIDLDLPGMGASPLRHDLFVEVDAMAGRAPAPGVLERVVRAFAIAPVGNPDGSGGISLHVFLDETNLPLVDWPAMLPEFYPVGAAQTRDAHFGTPAERAGGNAANILAARGLVFRYCVFGNTYNNGGSSGVARGIPGREFVVTLGAFPTPGGTPDQQAGTFMHELGHTLGLRHGGNDHVNNKPDYFSVMNYLYQFPTPANRDVWDLVYAGPDSPVYN
ncbi:MAG TPA: hypothetical protein VIL46_06680, partial [Gemmataceae bacterium]